MRKASYSSSTSSDAFFMVPRALSMKQYDKGSKWGIDGGRISKLMLKRDGEIVCNYDRGWDVEPADENTQLALELLLHSENW